MSYQLKQQSIGYICKGLYDMDCGKITISRAIELLQEIVPDTYDITNGDTLDYAEKVAEQMGIEVSELKSSVYWAFDFVTVEEAEAYFIFFNRGMHFVRDWFSKNSI